MSTDKVFRTTIVTVVNKDGDVEPSYNYCETMCGAFCNSNCNVLTLHRVWPQSLQF
jgi:hypothetical protein